MRGRASAMGFLTGVALLGAAQVVCVGWPEVRARFGDLAAWDRTRLDEPAWSLAIEAFDARPEPERALVAALSLGTLAVVLVALGRARAGFAVLSLDGLAVATFLFACTRWLQVSDERAPCGPAQWPFLASWDLVPRLAVLPFAVAVLAALAWLIAQARARILRWPAVVAAALALTMLAPGLVLARHVARDVPVAPWQPLAAGIVAAAWLASVVLALRRPLFTSHLVSTLTLLGGLVAAWPAIQVVHDARLEVHPSFVSWTEQDPVPLAHGRTPVLAPVVTLGAEVSFPEGVELERPEIAQALGEKLRALQELRADVVDPNTPPVLTLAAARSTPLADVRATLEAARTVGVTRVQIASFVDSAGPWSMPTRHRHESAVWLELADDGRPVTSWPSWEALVHDADRDGPPLHVR